MAPKVKKEASAPPKAEAKVKALKTKKSVPKGVHSHKKKIRTSPTLWWPKTLWLRRQPKYPRKSAPRRNEHGYYHQIPPDHRVSHGENSGQQHTVFTVDVEANKHQIKPAVRKLCDIDAAKVSIL
ncbi:large ribosomal subunit protein uL23-like [Meriones unguiculatus]|uniref:large ribosomal subunit protein uL23-like n=1 Tax=Meriones unguiculatus TaxID=10047 RepID=UPI00293E6022|nr:large ribosomal subunit protein uL23-like [Meriones unguiculatus]